MPHPSSDGGPRLRRRWIPIATHGAALLLGVLVWHTLPGDRASDLPQSAEAARRAASRQAVEQAIAWTDAALAELREAEAAKEREQTDPATMAEFLEQNRKNSKKWWRTREQELDQAITRANKLRDPSDPAASLRAAARNRNDLMDELVLFQHWLDTDPDAALAELERNWLLNERQYTAALLERKFGADWMIWKIADQGTSHRLRELLARELGLQAAQGRGLPELLEFYHSIPDPRLKNQVAFNFSWEWPLEDPREVARFLKGGVPKELQNLLLEQWANPQYGPSEWELKWMRELCEETGSDLLQKYFDPPPSKGGELAGFGQVMERWEARKSMTLEEVAQDVAKEGKAPQDAIREAIGDKLHRALAEGPDLLELFGEGKLTRAELLNQIRGEIPGSENHPEVLERAVWSQSAWIADPREIADWAEELSRRGDMDELMIQAFSTGNLYGNPRIPLRLARYRTITREMPAERPRSRILDHAAWEWTRWQDVSPAAAEAWRDQLPPQAPLLAAIREEEELERRRREDP